MKRTLVAAKPAARILAAVLASAALAALAVPAAQAASTAPNATAVEYFHASLRHYFISASADEIASIDAGGAGGGWERTGRRFAVWTADAAAAAPATALDVFRFYSYASNSHFYSADPGEVAYLRSLNPTNADRRHWILEGKAFKVEMPAAGACTPGLKPVYRSYNDRSAAGDSNHRIIGGPEVFSAMEDRGWVAEGVAMCTHSVDVDPALRAASTAEAAALVPTKMTGTVTDVPGEGRFTLLGVTVDASNARIEQGTESALRAGAQVEVEGYPAKGAIVATSIVVKSAGGPADPGGIRWEGYVSALATGGSIFVNGQLVDISRAVRTGGTGGTVGLGARVSVRGVIRSGVLEATHLEVKDDGDGSRHDAISSSELRGTVGGFVSLAQFEINGQRVDATRAYIENGSWTALANGVEVEAHGLMQGGVFIASRIEVKSLHGAGGGQGTQAASTMETEGVVANLSGGNWFEVNGMIVDASTAWFEHGTAMDLRNGVRVDVKGSLAGGILVAYKVEFQSGLDDGHHIDARIELRGRISAITGVDRFMIAGQAVDATHAVVWGPAGMALGVGMTVEVDGAILDGVLVASRIEVKSGSDDSRHDDEGDDDYDGTKAKGVISRFFSIADFVVAGQHVDATTARFEHGHAGLLAAGVYVEAKGRLVGGRLVATKIEFAH